MIRSVIDFEYMVTENELEALVLEANLIKQYRPRYNIILRDDKSYPYLFLSTEDEYPLLALHRGAKRKKGRYFGPYPSTRSVATSRCRSARLTSEAFKMLPKRPAFVSTAP